MEVAFCIEFIREEIVKKPIMYEQFVYKEHLLEESGSAFR
jgi:hypothetical protein